MSLWFVALQGTTPIGGPAIGGIIALAGPRAGLATGALACAAAAVLGLAVLRRLRRRPRGHPEAGSEAQRSSASAPAAASGHAAIAPGS